jgi:hypothetical protein
MKALKTTPTAGEKSRLADGISTAKDLFALLRDVAVGTIALLLLLFPSTFNDRLTQAGFEEGSFAGMKWKAKLVESDTGLKEARIQINNLQEQLALNAAKLKEAETRGSDPLFKTEVAKLNADTKSVSVSAAKVAANVSTIITSNAPLVERAQSSHEGLWGVIYSGDARPELAKYETEIIARKFGIPNASIFLDKNGSYRSVAVVESSEEAKDVLVLAKKRRPDAYIVRMASWCPNRIQKDGFQLCAVGP